MIRNDLRNIAIIAHVDHGKTTLVDEMLKQGGIFRANQDVMERVMDSNDLERERGITILAKNTAVYYKDIKINIIDTPGHADFSGEVERILTMVNGVLLLVDAVEGPMPQTRFVLQKALDLGLKIIIGVNKVDRKESDVKMVVDGVLDLLIDLEVGEEHLDSPIVYCSGRFGTSSLSAEVQEEDLTTLFETIIQHIDPPSGDEKGLTQVMISSIDYNEFVGRIGIGRVVRGRIKTNQEVIIADYHNLKPPYRAKIQTLMQIDGLRRIPVEDAQVGDIVCISGISNITIGDTICSPSAVEPMPFVKIDDPTLEMRFLVNNSPFAGKEGKFVTTRQLKDRLEKELLKDVSLKVEGTDSPDTYIVKGRGEMHLSILIETMRREGYEFAVTMPKVLYKTDEKGKKLEPMENLVIDVPSESVGNVMEKMGIRKGELINMSPVGSRIRMEFKIPARGLIGYKNEFLTDTKGEGVMSSISDGYAPFKGEIVRRNSGSLVAFETGIAVAYGLFNAQSRGILFIGAGVQVYEGMVVGVAPKVGDIQINVCKKKQMTNTRSSGSDDSLRLSPPRNMSLEEILEYIAEDEIIEVTPQSLRIRKTILNSGQRARSISQKLKKNL